MRVSYIAIAGLASIIELRFLSPLLFPVPAGLSLPALALILFIILTFGDAIAFGVGIAILVWALRSHGRWSNASRTPYYLLTIAALWFATVGWVHDGLHLATVDYMKEVVSGQLGTIYGQVLVIDLAFHGTTILFAAMILFSAFRLRKSRGLEHFTARRTKTILLVAAVVTGTVAFLSGPAVFPANGLPNPQGWVAFLATVRGIWNAAAFGLGISLLAWTIITWQRWRSAFGTPVLLLLGVANYVAIQAWIHDGLHTVIDNGLSHEIVSQQIGGAFYSLIGIEFLFHFPWLIYALLIIAGLTRLANVRPVVA